VGEVRRRAKKRKRTLFDALRDEGYEPFVSKHPWRKPGALGSPGSFQYAAVLSGRRIAVLGDNWDYAYAASHEIAEQMWGFQHSAEMFCQQANLLHVWIKDLAVNRPFVPGEAYAQRTVEHGAGVRAAKREAARRAKRRNRR
jgi:hypothetical protein